MDIGGEPLSKAEFTGGGDGRGDQSGVQERQLKALGVEFGVIAKGVADVCDVAGGPGHGLAPVVWEQWKVTSKQIPRPSVRRTGDLWVKLAHGGLWG